MPKLNLAPRPFYFMRHGETDANRNRIYHGSSNAPLNETGEQQAHEAAETLIDEGITTIAASPLLRARRTAEIVAERLGINNITIIDQLAECCLGELEGQPVPEKCDLMERFYAGNHPKGAESLLSLQDRIIAGMNKALDLQAGDSDGKILIVGHGGMHAVLRNLLGFQGDPHLHNCGIVFHRPPVTPATQWLMTRLDNDGGW